MHSMVDRPTSSAGETISTVGQPRRVLLQRLHRDSQTGQDDAAEIVAIAAHDVERRRRAEVDDDQIAARIEMRRADGVGDAIGTDFERIAIADPQPGLDARLQDERIDAEILAATAPQRIDDLRHDRTERDLLDRAPDRRRSRGARCAGTDPVRPTMWAGATVFRKRSVSSPFSNTPPKI